MPQLIDASRAKHRRGSSQEGQDDGDDVAPVPVLAGHDREHHQQHK